MVNKKVLVKGEADWHWGRWSSARRVLRGVSNVPYTFDEAAQVDREESKWFAERLNIAREVR